MAWEQANDLAREAIGDYERRQQKRLFQGSLSSPDSSASSSSAAAAAAAAASGFTQFDVGCFNVVFDAGGWEEYDPMFRDARSLALSAFGPVRRGWVTVDHHRSHVSSSSSSSSSLVSSITSERRN